VPEISAGNENFNSNFLPETSKSKEKRKIPLNIVIFIFCIVSAGDTTRGVAKPIYALPFPYVKFGACE
jgi:hypothetical protein